MKTSLIYRSMLSLLASAALIAPALSAPYAKGQKVDPFHAKDQYSAAFDFKPDATNYLLVSHDMETGKKANGVLTTLGKDFLPNKKAVYLANIHGMPGIGRMFAIPKMKKYAHRIILGDDENLISKFPEQKGKVTVIGISGGKVKSIGYWSPGAEELAPMLK